MRILHLNAGNETGGGMNHILSLLQSFNREEFVLGVFEKGELWRQACEAGIETVHFPHQTKMSMKLIRKIVDYMKENQICYVHTHGPRANVYARMLKRLVRFNWIVTVHSHPQHDFMDKGIYGMLLTKMNTYAIKQADKVIIVSEPFRTDLIKIGINNDKITTAYNGIDFHKKVDDSYKKTDFGMKERDFLFLMVARLEAVKGHQIAFEAFAEILRKDSNCHLMLLGDGELHVSLKEVAEDLGIVNHIHFLGHRDDVEKFYQMADVTLLTSLSEGFPLVLLESARMKTPIITTDVGSVNQLITNQSLGWKVPPNDIKRLVYAMKEALFLERKGELSIIGDEIYTYASTRFSLKAFTSNIYNVYLSMEDIN